MQMRSFQDLARLYHRFVKDFSIIAAPLNGLKKNGVLTRYTLLTQLDYKIFGLETIKDQYVHDADFKDVLLHCKDGKIWNKFILNVGFFLANKLCMPASSIRLLLLREVHGGGLMGNFGAKKMEDILACHFYWSKMRRLLVNG
jgi:hypothetical protein